MHGVIDPGKHRCHRIVAVICVLAALSLLAVLVLPGCGAENAAVEKQDERTETRREEEVVLEDEEITDPVEDEEEDYEESVALDREYTNDIYGFSVSYPDGWECEETERGNGCNIFDPYNDLFGALAWALPAEGKPAEDWLDHLFETVNNTYGVTGEWVIERDPSNSVHDTYNGADYVYEYWTYEAAGEDYYYDVMVMVEDDEVFYFTAQYPVDDVEEIEPIVDAMIDSYTLPGW